MNATQTTTPETSDAQRLNAIVGQLLRAVRDIAVQYRLTRAEYQAATDWLVQAGRENLLPLLMEVALEPTVDATEATARVSVTNPEGPYYMPGAPTLTSPCELPGAAEDDGTPLLFTGAVKSSDGGPLPGAVIDLWQANSAGLYSNVHPGLAPFALRGCVEADGEGRFSIRTVKPIPYPLAAGGPLLTLVEALGRPNFRPAHLHVKVTSPGHRPLTTQVYFAGDRYLETDLLGESVSQLVATPVDEKDESGRFLHARVTFDFVLQRLQPLPASERPEPLSVKKA